MDTDAEKELRIARKLIESQKTVITLLYELLEQRQPEPAPKKLQMKVIKLPTKKPHTDDNSFQNVNG